MTANGWFQICFFFALVLVCAKPLGLYMARVFERERTFADRILRPVERLIYRLTGIDETHEMPWTEYAVVMLIGLWLLRPGFPVGGRDRQWWTAAGGIGQFSNGRIVLSFCRGQPELESPSGPARPKTLGTRRGTASVCMPASAKRNRKKDARARQRLDARTRFEARSRGELTFSAETRARANLNLRARA